MPCIVLLCTIVGYSDFASLVLFSNRTSCLGLCSYYYSQNGLAEQHPNSGIHVHWCRTVEVLLMGAF